MTDNFRAWRDLVLERMRVVIVAGVATGVVVVGLGSRIAMFLLRITSPERVNGLQSDDDFTIGQVTLAGTYNLIFLGGITGLIGFAVYRCVSPWLIGPHWFRRLTIALGSGAVVGAMLVHSDGIDFTVLKPTWFAIGLFVALPALFAVAMVAAVDSVSRPDSWTRRGRWRWLLPVLVIACVPVALIFVVMAAVPVGLWAAVARDADIRSEIRRQRWFANAVRACWLTIAVLGLVSLLNDVNALI